MKSKVKFYRDFGSLSDDSVVTDIYKKRAKREKTYKRNSKCTTRMATEEEKRKYNISGGKEYA